MLPECESDITELRKRYFMDELGLADEEVSDAAANLLGAFGVLSRIEERLSKQVTAPV
jgi:hypothetical protein